MLIYIYSTIPTLFVKRSGLKNEIQICPNLNNSTSEHYKYYGKVVLFTFPFKRQFFLYQEKVDNWLTSTVGKTDICDRLLSKSLEQLYDLLFSNSNFYFNFQKDRGTTELDIGNWEEDDV